MDERTPEPSDDTRRAEDGSPPPDRPGAGSRAGNTTLPWIIAALCALAAIGVGIWGFTTKSDLDDANATIERQRERLASEQRTAAATETRLEAFGRRTREAYRRVRRGLVNERAVAADLQKKVRTEAGALEQARQEVSNAQGRAQQEAARLKQALAERSLAVACSASAVDALNRFFDAPNVRAGASRAIKQLEATQEECQRAAAEG